MHVLLKCWWKKKTWKKKKKVLCRICKYNFLPPPASRWRSFRITYVVFKSQKPAYGLFRFMFLPRRFLFFFRDAGRNVAEQTSLLLSSKSRDANVDFSKSIYSFFCFVLLFYCENFLLSSARCHQEENLAGNINVIPSDESRLVQSTFDSDVVLKLKCVYTLAVL